MASTQKKTTASTAGKGGGGKRTSTGPSRASGGKRTSATPPAPNKKPIRREVGAVICLLLGFFSAFGYFHVQAAFIDLFCGLLKGCLGYGFYIMPPMLLVAAWGLAFHRGRPVRLRLFCALIAPVLVGAILHLLLSREEIVWGMGMAAPLWKSGLTMTSGGALSGLLGMALQYAFSKVGALVVLIVVGVLAFLKAFNRGFGDVVAFLKARRENRPQYEPEEEAPQPKAGQAAPAAAAIAGRKRAIDIPVDDHEPVVAPRKPTTPVTTVRKKRLFDRVASVLSPDKVLSGESGPILEAEPPEYEDTPEFGPVKEKQVTQNEPVVPETAPTPNAPPAAPVPAQPESRAAAEPVPQPPAEQPPVEESPADMPPVVREPAVDKVTREDAQSARAQVEREIEAGMEQARPAYRYPPLTLLAGGGSVGGGETLAQLHANQQRLEGALQSFGVNARIVDVTCGPSVALYELELEQGVKLNKITNLSDDIALALGAQAVRIAPVRDKIATVGIEVPNKQVASVPIRDVIGSDTFENSPSKVSFAVGKDIGGNPVVGNIAKLPHMLIAGTTGSGKSVCTNSLIISLLYKSTPDEVRMIMVDPKMVELGMYNGIPHLLIPVVTDPKKAAGALQWAVNEMMKRYRTFSEIGVKDLASYNSHAARREDMEALPQIVVIIDELADLMLVAAKEVEESICRIAQMGRASGIHLVIATQRPSADVITGLMKANIPSRIAFAVASSLESRIILDNVGAEKLVGKGDMLYGPVGEDRRRVQGCFVSEEEVAAVVEFIKQSGSASYDEEVIHEIERHAQAQEKGAKGSAAPEMEGGQDDYDELLPAAIEVVVEARQASVSMLQRRLKLGYGRAARLVDQMEEKGVVGPFEGAKPRQVIITREQWQEMQFRQGMVDRVPEPAYGEPVPDELPFEGDVLPQSWDRPPFDQE